MTYALIACSKSKQDHRCPAKEMYTGDMFKKSYELAEKRKEKIYILSAKHHLLDPDKEIEPYNEYLSDFSAEEKQAWYEEVIKEMKAAGISENATIHTYAGNDYIKGLEEAFPKMESQWKGEGMGYIMENLDKELGRSLPNYEHEQRDLADGASADEDRKISGYAAVFNSRSEYLGFYETLMPGSITEETIQLSDVICTFNHQPDVVLARSKYGQGTLHLSVDEKGLYYEFEAPNTTAGNDLLEMIKRGDITGCSFAFAVDPEEAGVERWERMDDGNMHRIIFKIARLFDVSPVVHPAYEAAQLTKRSQASIEEIRQAEEEAKEKARVDALNKKYDAMLAEIDTL